MPTYRTTDDIGSWLSWSDLPSKLFCRWLATSLRFSSSEHGRRGTMSNGRLTSAIINCALILGIGVMGWAYFTPSEEEKRKKLQGFQSPSASTHEDLYGKKKEKQMLMDILKESAGITDKDLKKK